MAFNVKTFFEYFVKDNDDFFLEGNMVPVPCAVDGDIKRDRNGNLKLYADLGWVFGKYHILLSKNEKNGKRDVNFHFKSGVNEFTACFIEGETCSFEFANGKNKATGTIKTLEIRDEMGEEGGLLHIFTKARWSSVQFCDLEVKITSIPRYDA